MANIDKMTYNGEEYKFIDKEIRDILFFKPGETCTIKTYATNGHITSSQKNIYFQVVLPKHMTFVSSPQITSLKINIRRPEGGYIDQSGAVSGGVEYVGNSNYTMNINGKTANTIEIRIIKNSDIWGNSVNNTPISVEISTLVLQF